MSNSNDEKIHAKVIELRREYRKTHYAKNRQRVRAYQNAWWKRKALKALQEEQDDTHKGGEV